MISNLAKAAQGDPALVGGIFPSQASGRRHSYMLVESRYHLGLGMALVLYVPI